MKRIAAAVVVAAVWLHGAGVSAQSRDRWFGRDKALHFAFGAGIAGAGYAGASLVTRDRKPRVVVGLTFGIGANAAKELQDRRGGGDPSWKDLTIGALGSVAGSTVAWLIDRH